MRLRRGAARCGRKLHTSFGRVPGVLEWVSNPEEAQ